MPNWCSTTYHIVGDKEEVLDLYNKLSKLEKISSEYSSKKAAAHLNKQPLPEVPPEIVDSDFGFFLGSIVQAFGGDWKEIYCRGEVSHLQESDGDYIYLSTETAWGDMPQVWDFVMSKYKTLKYYFLAEEPGCEYYVNSDTTGEYFPEKYYIDNMYGCDIDYADSDESLLSSMAEILEIESIASFEELNKLLDEHNQKNEDEPIYYHKFREP